ncbi:MAG: DMT family transporter [Chloroflexota bacterium]
MGLPAEVLAFLAALFLALSQVAAKKAVTSLPPTLFLAIRWPVSLGILSAIALVTGGWREFKMDPAVPWVIVGGFLGPVAAWSMYTRAIVRLDVSIAYAITQLSVIGTILVATVLLGERPGFAAVTGATVIVVGASLLNGRPDRWRHSKISRAGVLLVLGAVSCWSFSFVIWKIGVTSLTVLQTVWLRILVPTIVMSAVVASSQKYQHGAVLLTSVTRRSLLMAAVMAFLSDVVAFGLQFFALQVGTVAVVTPIAGTSPLFLAGLSMAFLGERLSPWQWFGIMLIVAGAALVSGG